MTTHHVNAKLVDSHQGAKTYAITLDDGRDAGHVEAASPADAIQIYFQRRCAEMSAQIGQMVELDVAAAVVRAVESGGATPIERTAHGVVPYVAAARRMGYAAETHTVGGRVWLRVARDARSLDALKSQIDRDAIEAPSPMSHHDIKAARQHLGLTQRELASMLDTDHQTVQRMEIGADKSTHRPPAPRMERLIRAYLDGYRPRDWPQG